MLFLSSISAVSITLIRINSWYPPFTLLFLYLFYCLVNILRGSSFTFSFFRLVLSLVLRCVRSLLNIKSCNPPFSLLLLCSSTISSIFSMVLVLPFSFFPSNVVSRLPLCPLSNSCNKLLSSFSLLFFYPTVSPVFSMVLVLPFLFSV